MCAYDRAGLGWTDLGPTPRSAARIVDELHILLETAGVSGPYILTGALRGVVSMCGSTRAPTRTMSPEWCWLMPRMKTKVDACPLLLVPGQSTRSSCTFGTDGGWFPSSHGNPVCRQTRVRRRSPALHQVARRRRPQLHGLALRWWASRQHRVRPQSGLSLKSHDTPLSLCCLLAIYLTQVAPTCCGPGLRQTRGAHRRAVVFGDQATALHPKTA